MLNFSGQSAGPRTRHHATTWRHATGQVAGQKICRNILELIKNRYAHVAQDLNPSLLAISAEQEQLTANQNTPNSKLFNRNHQDNKQVSTALAPECP